MKNRFFLICLGSFSFLGCEGATHNSGKAAKKADIAAAKEASGDGSDATADGPSTNIAQKTTQKDPPNESQQIPPDNAAPPTMGGQLPDPPTEAGKVLTSDANKTDSKSPLIALTDENVLSTLTQSETQMDKLCAASTGFTNRVVQKFCVEKFRPKNLIDLQTALNIAVKDPTLTTRGQNGTGGNPAFVFQGHSSSLVGKFVSAINPRVVIFSPENLGRNTANPAFFAMGFVRGEQLVEMIANEPTTNKPEFYLLSFKQACNDRPGGCNMGELLTPAIEINWTGATVYRAADLANTIVDCFQCHRPAGAATTPTLRMQEEVNPWTHWFRDSTAGAGLISDYQAAHPATETYGGIPGAMIGASDPAKLENLLRGNGFGTQPNEFLTSKIQGELNATPLVSATWKSLFAQVVAGNAIPVPYHELRVTDPALLAKFTKQYKDFAAGTVPLDKFEDHRNILVTDPKQLGDTGFAIAPGTAPKDMLMLACNQCHNSKQDQTITRAKFDVNLASIKNPGEEIDKAILRLRLGYSPDRLKTEKIEFTDMNGHIVDLAKSEHVLTMPPRRMKQLTDDQIDSLVTYLKDQRSQIVKP